MTLHQILAHPMLVWFVLFAILLTMFVWPAKGWRAVVITVCTVLVGLIVALYFLRA